MSHESISIFDSYQLRSIACLFEDVQREALLALRLDGDEPSICMPRARSTCLRVRLAALEVRMQRLSRALVEFGDVATIRIIIHTWTTMTQLLHHQ